ncbi:NUDIX domain-containing protein [Echinicola soli]|uniref:NUDIX domain-containing protein n=1 Tax=Echinicola soli TaxID=2591634 RepID=A0A514CHZ4_9BACT|nr:NUDIX domain-containing protein [Echinicola soli]QDH79449.1 NUDIX domain-containing protein [Echinicola soli]
MQNLEKEINEKFGGRLRTRVNGVLILEDKILMVKHHMGNGKCFWNVPGGGMDYQSTAPENLKREFLEETGFMIQIGPLLTVTEFLKPPLHAVELFFEVSKESGQLKRGTDPELPDHAQLIEDVRFMSLEEINQIPNDEKHHLFWKIKSLNDIRIWKGYFNFENKCIK